MSATTNVIDAMRNSGFVLELDGDRLKVRVPPGCPSFYKDLLRSRKQEFIAALKEQQATDARWWRLDTPKRCTDCRHARPTSHPALVDCDQRDDQPSCGYWWSTDEKLCLEWAPSHTDTHGQTADNELRNAR